MFKPCKSHLGMSQSAELRQEASVLYMAVGQGMTDLQESENSLKRARVLYRDAKENLSEAQRAANKAELDYEEAKNRAAQPAAASKGESTSTSGEPASHAQGLPDSALAPTGVAPSTSGLASLPAPSAPDVEKSEKLIELEGRFKTAKLAAVKDFPLLRLLGDAIKLQAESDRACSEMDFDLAEAKDGEVAQKESQIRDHLAAAAAKR